MQNLRKPEEVEAVHHDIHSQTTIGDNMLVFGDGLPKVFISIHRVVLELPEDHVIVKENTEPEE